MTELAPKGPRFVEIIEIMDRQDMPLCRLLELQLEISKKLKWMKYLLFGYHENWPMYKYFLLILVLKTTSFLNTYKNCRYKASTLQLSEMIALFILYLRNYFLLRWEGPIFFGRGHVEK